MGAFVGAYKGRSCYRTKRGRGHFAGAVAAGAIVTSVCFRRPRDQTAPPSIATFGDCAAIGGILLPQMFLALVGNN
jgi:hypothetical protein